MMMWMKTLIACETNRIERDKPKDNSPDERLKQKQRTNSSLIISHRYLFYVKCLFSSLYVSPSFPNHNCPDALTTTFCVVFPDGLVPTLSIFLTTSIPLVTVPNTTCFPSNHAVFTVHRKNWDPFVFAPAFAIERIPGPVCFNLKFSSLNFSP